MTQLDLFSLPAVTQAVTPNPVTDGAVVERRPAPATDTPTPKVRERGRDGGGMNTTATWDRVVRSVYSRRTDDGGI